MKITRAKKINKRPIYQEDGVCKYDFEDGRFWVYGNLRSTSLEVIKAIKNLEEYDSSQVEVY